MNGLNGYLEYVTMTRSSALSRARRRKANWNRHSALSNGVCMYQSCATPDEYLKSDLLKLQSPILAKDTKQSRFPL